MGGAVSAGEDNDELIDKLVEAEYIKTPQLEQIFRAVDRGYYYLEGCKETAYRDLAWKHGNIHLSAPCIYSEVMESLKLGPGMSFLNLGSGTGYLSTMAGLVLGTFGVNHGVELHSEVVDYARAKLDEFQSTSPALDKYEFCPPSFVVGNCLQLDSSCAQYDRVYCGASCPTEHENYIKNLVRVGGILVMPLNDHLLQVTRTGELTYDVKNVLPVSFASLVVPDSSENRTFVKLPEKHPLSLKEICRSLIRIILRTNAERENPSLKNKKKSVPRRRKSKRRLRKVVIPVFEGGRPVTVERQSHDEVSDPADDESSIPVEPNMFEFRSPQTLPKVKKSSHCAMYEDRVVFENNGVSIGLKPLDSDEDQPSLSNDNFDGSFIPEQNSDNKNENSSCTSQTGISSCGKRSLNTIAFDNTDENPIDGYSKSLKGTAIEDKNASNSDEEMISHVNVVHGPRSSSLDIITFVSSNNGSRKESQTDSDCSRRGSLAKASDSGRDSGSQEDTPCSSLQQERHLTEKLNQEKKQNTLSTLNAEKGSSDQEDMDIEEQEFEAMTSDKDECGSSEENQNGVSRPKCPRSGKREAETDESDIRSSYPRVGNVDSGIDNISDDSVPDECSPEPCPGNSPAVKDSADASLSLQGQSSYLKRVADTGPAPALYPSRLPSICCTKAVVFKRIAYSDVDSDDLAEFDSDSGKESFPKDYEVSREKSDLSCYTYHMKQKISLLPLPQFLKMYLNYSKPL